MLDYILIVIAGLAVFAQALLGLLVSTRPPSEQRRIRYEVAFVIIGIVGLISVVWSGIRTVNSSSHVETTLSNIQTNETESSKQLQRLADALHLNHNQSAQALADEIIARLDSQIAPLKQRHLEAPQTSEMSAAAKAMCPIKPGIPVTANNSNHEAQVYASEFVNVLKGAGCDANLDLPIPGLKPDFKGIAIGVRDKDNISPGAISLAKVLTRAQVKFSIHPMEPDFFSGSEFVLVVGAKPEE